MKVEFKRPELNGKTDKENIAKLDTYLAELAMKLDYIINHLEDDNFVKQYATKDELREELKEAKAELRAYINSKGENV